MPFVGSLNLFNVLYFLFPFQTANLSVIKNLVDNGILSLCVLIGLLFGLCFLVVGEYDFFLLFSLAAITHFI